MAAAVSPVRDGGEHHHRLVAADTQALSEPNDRDFSLTEVVGATATARMPQTILMLKSGNLSIWQLITSPFTTGPTFSGVPE